jgi:hypothetical protein
MPIPNEERKISVEVVYARSPERAKSSQHELAGRRRRRNSWVQLSKQVGHVIQRSICDNDVVVVYRQGCRLRQVRFARCYTDYDARLGMNLYNVAWASRSGREGLIYIVDARSPSAGAEESKNSRHITLCDRR